MSKVDVSLDELVTMDGRKWGRGGAGAGRSWGPRRRGAAGGALSRAPQAADLRDVLAKKKKLQVVDLRTKLKSKEVPPRRGRPLQLTPRGRITAPIAPPKRARSRSPIHKWTSPVSQAAHPGMRRRRSSPVRLPSRAEAKKITVTVPGLSRPVSEVRGRRGEDEGVRLPAAI